MIDKYIIELYQSLEQEVIADIARRIKKTGRYTETAEIMVKSMTEHGFSASRIQAEVMKLLRADPEYIAFVAQNTKEYKAFVQNEIKAAVKQAKENGDALISEAGNMAYNSDLSMWKQAGVDLGKPNSLSQIMDAFEKQTADRLKNLTKTTGFKNTAFGFTPIQHLYQKELDFALLKVASGVFSYDQVVNDCVHRLAQSGLRTIDYASGRSYQLDTAARMCVRTGLSQLSGKITEANIAKTGVELVITSQHMGSRPEHAVWQNKVFSYSGKNKKYPDFVKATGYGSVEGLKGANCAHDFFPFWEGISVIPEDIKEPPPVIVNGKEYTYYQATQRQRSMERNIRATKREIEAQKAIGGDTTELRKSLRQQAADYHSFSAAVGIRAKDNRLRVASGASDLTKTKSYKDAIRAAERRSAGALTRKNDPLRKRRNAHAERYYEEIRNRRPSYIIRRISKNTGISENVAKNIYEHMFTQEHLFRDGTVKLFDPDYDMAESFRRILEGKDIKPHDIIMLKHENLELNLMKKYNMTYEDAHELTDKKYNYVKELLVFLRELED